jgi:hypothetical protein
MLLQLCVQVSYYFVVEQASNPSSNFRHKPVKNTKSSDVNADVPVEKIEVLVSLVIVNLLISCVQ